MKEKFRILVTLIFILDSVVSSPTKKPKDLPQQLGIQLNKLVQVNYPKTLAAPFSLVEAKNSKFIAFNRKQVMLLRTPRSLRSSKELQEVGLVSIENSNKFNFEDVIFMKDGTFQVLRRAKVYGEMAYIDIYSDELTKMGTIDNQNLFNDQFLNTSIKLLELPGIEYFKAAIWKQNTLSILQENKISHFPLSEVFEEKGVLDNFEIKGFIISNNPKNQIAIVSVFKKEFIIEAEDEGETKKAEVQSNFPNQSQFSLYFDQSLMKFRYTDMDRYVEIYKYKYKALSPGLAGFFGIEEEMLASIYYRRQQEFDSKIFLSLFYYSNDTELYGHDITGDRSLRNGTTKWLKHSAIGDLVPPIQFELPERINTTTMVMTSIPFSTLILVKYTSQTPDDITGHEVLRLIGLKSFTWREDPKNGEFNKIVEGSTREHNRVNILLKKDRMFSEITTLDESAKSFLIKVENNQDLLNPLLYLTNRLDGQNVPQFDCLDNEDVLGNRRVCYKCEGYLKKNYCLQCHPNLFQPDDGQCAGCLDTQYGVGKNCYCSKPNCKICTTPSKCVSCNHGYALSMGDDSICLKVGSKKYIEDRKKHNESYERNPELEEKKEDQDNSSSSKNEGNQTESKEKKDSETGVDKGDKVKTQQQQSSNFTEVHFLLVIVIGLLVFSFAAFLCMFMAFGIYIFNTERQKNQILMNMLEQHLSPAESQVQIQNRSIDQRSPLESEIDGNQYHQPIQNRRPVSLLEGVSNSQGNSVYARTLLEGVYGENTRNNSENQHFEQGDINPRFTEASYGSQGMSQSDFSVLENEATRTIYNRRGQDFFNLNERHSSSFFNHQRTQPISIPEAGESRRDRISDERSKKMSRIFLNANEDPGN